MLRSITNQFWTCHVAVSCCMVSSHFTTICHTHWKEPLPHREVLWPTRLTVTFPVLHRADAIWCLCSKFPNLPCSRPLPGWWLWHKNLAMRTLELFKKLIGGFFCQDMFIMFRIKYSINGWVFKISLSDLFCRKKCSSMFSYSLSNIQYNCLIMYNDIRFYALRSLGETTTVANYQRRWKGCLLQTRSIAIASAPLLSLPEMSWERKPIICNCQLG